MSRTGHQRPWLAEVVAGLLVASTLTAGVGVAVRSAGEPAPVATSTVRLPGPPAAPAVTPGPRPTPPASAAPSTAPSAAPAARPGRTPQPVPDGTGELVVVPGTSAVAGSGGRLVRYRVEVEEGTGQDGAAFAAAVERVLGDPRGWGAQGRLRFQRVSTGGDFAVTLAGPATTDRLCRPLRTGGIFSCYDSRGRAVVNLRRWLEGARSYAGALDAYRQYVVSHEVGHALGHGHVTSCDAQGRAGTMQQQTKGLAGCSRNPWPYPDAG